MRSSIRMRRRVKFEKLMGRIREEERCQAGMLSNGDIPLAGDGAKFIKMGRKVIG
jgi:hypothetical protein